MDGGDAWDFDWLGEGRGRVSLGFAIGGMQGGGLSWVFVLGYWGFEWRGWDWWEVVVGGICIFLSVAFISLRFIKVAFLESAVQTR